jgi:hypothetical protein
MINQIKDFLSPHLDVDGSNKTKMMFTNGTSVTSNDSLKLIQHMDNIEAFLPEMVVFLIKPENKALGKVVVEKLKADKVQARLEELRASSNLDDGGGEPLDITTLEIFVDISKKREVEFLVNPRDRRIVTGFSYAAWKRVVGNSVDSDARAAKIEYNPTNLKAYRRVVAEEDRVLQGVPIFNRYYAPDWKLRRVNGETGSLHPTMELFFNHFIPDLACREYVFERMMMMVDKRLPIILVMNTLTGTGKGLFVESILRYGVGRDNWTAAPKSWDKSGFNSWMDSKQIVWFDEEKVMPDGENANTNYLKRLANDHQAIEKKGQDVTGATRVHTSIIVTNNQGTKNFRLEEDNRRFSVIDVGLEKMSVIHGDDEANRIGEAIANNEDGMIDDFWLWLSANYSSEKKGNPFTLWKGDAYKMFLYESRTLWQKTIIDMCRSGENVKIYRDELKTEFESRKDSSDRSKFPTHKVKIESFLKEFTDESQRLGTMTFSTDTSNREWWIEVNPHWISEDTKQNERLGLKEVDPKYDNEVNTAERIEQLEDDYDLGDL